MTPSELYLKQSGRATSVIGLPEEVVAMMFAFFSRSKHTVRQTFETMVESGDLALPAEPPIDPTTERSRKFHERMTIGYGHKSVADHATVHWALEGVSMAVERDYMSARLIAATSKSTRFVDFRDAGYVTPSDWPAEKRSEYDAHVETLLRAYEQLKPLAITAMRLAVPYDDQAKTVWVKESGWEAAIEKRALDMIRDVLPVCVKTSFGVSCSATGLRELLDKRSNWITQPNEVMETSLEVRAACRMVVPTLLPEEPRSIPRHKPIKLHLIDFRHGITGNAPEVTLLKGPDWHLIREVTGEDQLDMIRSWMDRAHHMPPDRSAELATYTFRLRIPYAIHRDLGRHRMMTQLDGIPGPTFGYGADPLLLPGHPLHAMPEFRLLAATHSQVLHQAHGRVCQWAATMDEDSLQYAMPLATMVPVVWHTNLRELTHIIGLRTTPQGHPSYRKVAQEVARLIVSENLALKPYVEAAANFTEVLVGRPG